MLALLLRVFRSMALPLALAALGASGFGCGTGEGDAPIQTTFDACLPLVIRPATDATAEQLAAVTDGLALWNQRAGTRLTLEPLPEAAVVPLVFQAAALAFHGLYDEENGVIYVNSGLTAPHDVAVTVAHEVGHALGLLHVSSTTRASVMNVGNLTVEPTPEDAEAVAALWGPCGVR